MQEWNWFSKAFIVVLTVLSKTLNWLGVRFYCDAFYVSYGDWMINWSTSVVSNAILGKDKPCETGIRRIKQRNK